jgi:hypothetical protein
MEQGSQCGWSGMKKRERSRRLSEKRYYKPDHIGLMDHDKDLVSF